MSFATRCPSCSTTFRVVRDQLKVSEGWVRCGRCGEVFCALDSLFELERDLPADDQPHDELMGDRTLAPSAPPAEEGRPEAAPDALAPGDEASLLRPGRLLATPADEEAVTSADVLDSRMFEDRDLDKPWPAARRATEPADTGDFEDARFGSTLGEADFAPTGGEAPAEAPASPSEPAGETAAAEAAPVAPEAVEPPSFLQQAEREERLRRPAVRAALALLVLALAALLGLQVALQQRETLAAGWPATRPWLAQLCDWSGCKLGPLRRIDDLVIDHSTLVDAGPGREGYRLKLLLSNRSDATLAMPAIELTLTDAGGELVTRRALLPSDFQPGETAIAARAQVALSLDFSAPGRRLTSFTVEPFYP